MLLRRITAHVKAQNWMAENRSLPDVHFKWLNGCFWRILLKNSAAFRCKS